jgi:hypothetical protein
MIVLLQLVPLDVPHLLTGRASGLQGCRGVLIGDDLRRDMRYQAIEVLRCGAVEPVLVEFNPWDV